MNFREELMSKGMNIPYGKDVNYLSKPLAIFGKTLRNRIGILPLEGFDCDKNGTPTEHVYRRYLRFVEGGAGLIWFEACAVSDDGKSNPYQMMLRDENVDEFRALLSAMDERAAELGREKCIKVLQLTHSGRVSKNDSWESTPISPKKYGEQDLAALASDERIEQMVKEHIHAAELAALAGFDAVDIKVCHGYFLSELLSAYHREGKYGGSFENRTRVIFEIIDGIREAVGDKIGLSVRLNAYDSRPYPDGYGIVERDGRLRADLSETTKLCKLLKEHGVELINISSSAPKGSVFGEEPNDPKYGRFSTSCDYLMAVKLLKGAVKGVSFMCTGLSSFGAEGGYIGAGGVEEGWFDIAGFGRQALAYPSFASDIFTEGGMKEDKCCVNCYKCYSLMDPGHCRTGCIVRDSEEFYPIYRRNVLKKE